MLTQTTPFRRIRTAGKVQGAGRSLSLRRAWYAEDPAKQLDADPGDKKADADKTDADKDADKSDDDGDDDDALAKLSPKELAEIVRKVRRENGDWRTKLREKEAAEAKIKADQDAAEKKRQAEENKKLADQGEFKTLYEQQQAELQALKDKAARADAYEEKLKARNEARVKAIPETHRKLIPTGYSPQQLEEWLDASEPLITNPKAPNLNPGKQGERKITVDPAKTLKRIPH